MRDLGELKFFCSNCVDAADPTSADLPAGWFDLRPRGAASHPRQSWTWWQSLGMGGILRKLPACLGDRCVRWQYRVREKGLDPTGSVATPATWFSEPTLSQAIYATTSSAANAAAPSHTTTGPTQPAARSLHATAKPSAHVATAFPTAAHAAFLQVVVVALRQPRPRLADGNESSKPCVLPPHV